jgi:hypothetical protein
MLDRFGTNPTQVAGLLSFAASTIACVIATRRSCLDSRAWRVLGFINGLFVFEVFIGLRHRIHDYVNAILMAEGEYSQRRGMQESIIIWLATIALVCVTLLLFSRRLGGTALRIAAGLTAGLVTLFAIETVSLHALDAIYYRPIGSVLLIGWLWALAAAGICWAALTVKG